MEFRTWLEMQQHQQLWHGTSESAEILLRDGLKAQPAGPGQAAVYLTDNPQLALEYAETDQDRTGNSTLCVITINLSQLDQSKLGPDLDHGAWDDDGNKIETWADSLRACDQCVYYGNISPSAFSGVEVWDENGEYRKLK